MQKKKKEPSFEYLKDGYEEQGVLQWSERLKENPAQVLQACEDAVTHAGGDALEEKIAECRDRMLELLGEFCDTLAARTSDIPKPSGIFLSAEERRPAYRAICRVLGEAETFRRDLEAAIIELLAVDSLLARNKRARNEAARILADVGAATRRIPVRNDFFSAHGALRARLTQETERALRVREKLTVLQDKIKIYHEKTLQSFCSTVEVSADMAHDGEACNPLKLIRVCGELLALTQSVFSQIKSIEI